MIDAEVARAKVDEQQQSSNDGCKARKGLRITRLLEESDKYSHSVWKKSYLGEAQIKVMTCHSIRRNRNSLEEVSLRMRRMHRPPIVDKEVEDTEDADQEHGCDFGLVPDGNHDTCGETYD